MARFAAHPSGATMTEGLEAPNPALRDLRRHHSVSREPRQPRRAAQPSRRRGTAAGPTAVWRQSRPRPRSPRGTVETARVHSPGRSTSSTLSRPEWSARRARRVDSRPP